MFLPTEDCAAAVFALLAPLNSASPKIVNTLSRDLIPATQIGQGQCPAVFQVCPGFAPNTRTMGGTVGRVITFEWFVYVWGGPGGSTALNQIVDACMNTIPTDDGTGNMSPLFVDEIACPIWWEPDVAMLPNVPGISNLLIARIEVKLLVPPVVPA